MGPFLVQAAVIFPTDSFATKTNLFSIDREQKYG